MKIIQKTKDKLKNYSKYAKMNLTAHLALFSHWLCVTLLWFLVLLHIEGKWYMYFLLFMITIFYCVYWYYYILSSVLYNEQLKEKNKND